VCHAATVLHLLVPPTKIFACCRVLFHNCQELMWRGSDPLVVLRLLVLLSFVGNGLPKKHAGESGGKAIQQAGEIIDVGKGAGYTPRQTPPVAGTSVRCMYTC
jgi:hypothetical protein